MSQHPAYLPHGSTHTVQGLVVSAFDANPHAWCLRLVTSRGIQSAWLRNGLIPFQIAPGQVWDFTGEIVDLQQYGEQLEIQRAMPAVPADAILAPFLAHHVPGLSLQRAQRMREALGTGLIACMNHGEVAPIARALGCPAPAQLAVLVVSIWADQVAYTELAQELYKYGITEKALRTAVGHYGQRSVAQVRDDPYRLLAFSEFGPVDQAALKHFRMRDDDERRLMGTVDAAVYALHDRGSSIFTQKQLEKAVGEQSNLQQRQVVNAINLALQHGRLVGAGERHLMGEGFARIERAVIQFLSACNRSPSHSTAAANLTRAEDTREVAQVASEAAATKVSIILAHEELVAFSLVKCVADLFGACNERCYVLAGSDALCQRIDAATGLQSMTLRRAVAEGLCEPNKVPPPRAIAIVSSTIDFVDMARLLLQLHPADRLMFIGRPLPHAGERTLLLPALLSVDQIFRRELPLNTIIDPVAKAASRCVSISGITKRVYIPSESDHRGAFWICVADNRFERAVVGVSHQLRRHGSVAIVTRDDNEQRHYAQLINEAMVDTGAPGLGTVSVVTVDSVEPGDSDSTVVVLREPAAHSASWFQAAVRTAASRAVTVTTVQIDFTFSTMQDDYSAQRDFATRWLRASAEHKEQGQHK